MATKQVSTQQTVRGIQRTKIIKAIAEQVASTLQNSRAHAHVTMDMQHPYQSKSKITEPKEEVNVLNTFCDLNHLCTQSSIVDI